MINVLADGVGVSCKVFCSIQVPDSSEVLGQMLTVSMPQIDIDEPSPLGFRSLPGKREILIIIETK